MNQEATTQLPGGAVSIYDRFTNLYDLMFRFNRYGRSVERYLRENPLPLPADARVLDAGCGTGLLTLALLRVLKRPARITAFDLSRRSLHTARRAARRRAKDGSRHRATFLQADALALPFADESFDFVVTSGVLEYLPLDRGMSELARVLRPGGYFFHIPVRPSLATVGLELMFRFKAHPPDLIDEETERHFNVIEHHHFSPLEPIGWTKTAYLAQKP
jgi:ubiquinone/menaquinone biosynthesis C-methylase UbiE